MTSQPPTQTDTRLGPVGRLRRLAGRSPLVKWLLIIIGLAVTILIARGVLYFMVLWSLGDSYTDDTIPCDCPEFEQAALDVPWPGASESFILGTTAHRNEGGDVEFVVVEVVDDPTLRSAEWFDTLEAGGFDVARDPSDSGGGSMQLADVILVFSPRPVESQVHIRFLFTVADRSPDESLQPMIDLLTER